MKGFVDRRIVGEGRGDFWIEHDHVRLLGDLVRVLPADELTEVGALVLRPQPVVGLFVSLLNRSSVALGSLVWRSCPDTVGRSRR